MQHNAASKLDNKCDYLPLTGCKIIDYMNENNDPAMHIVILMDPHVPPRGGFSQKIKKPTKKLQDAYQ